ncbi:MAG: PIN domain-containing protein [Candidatus Dormibacteraeota bacterium]|nr:PIN domain-containing protein [Candidatus Dormibacteraeota bacterium]
MTVVADTSVWITFLRTGARGDAARLDALLSQQAVVVCGPVLAEILAGAGSQDRVRLQLLFAGLPWADIDRTAWGRVGDVAAELRERGETVPLTDIAIAVATEGADAQLWSWDGDFDRVAGVMPSLRRFRP